MRKTLTNPSFISLLSSYTSFIKVSNYKTGKSNNYQSAVSDFLIWLEVSGITKIKQVTSKESVAYFEYLITRPKMRGEGTLADNTIKFQLFALGLFQMNLLDNHEIDNTFYIPYYSQFNQKDRNILSVEQVKTVYQHCENHQERALLSVAYGCGLRRSEIEALDIQDIQLLSGMLIVRSGKNSKRREVPMSNPVMEYLRQYLTQERYNFPTGDGALFVNAKAERISGDHLNTMLKKMIEQTEQYELIKSDITLHCLRHSIAFHLAENNAGIEFIRRFLGHAQINTTYLYAIKNKKRKPITTF
jgi:site-specific recombinase XerD